MNVDRPSDSNSSNSCGVTSKYFDGKSCAEESLSEFQEKKIFASAKSSQKKTNKTKPRPKNNLKRIRGQKDIKSALKSKNNDLVTYSNDFDKICQQSGIDVDSEQLQLAIALSKSLQKSNTSPEDDTSSSKPLSSQERIGKIRTTLKEYGFVVPEIKIAAKKGRKLKKYQKKYKLIEITQAEKQQIVSDKYSQVLFETLDNTKATNNSIDSNKFSVLYHKGTDISYKELKDNAILYIENLLEKLPSSVGCLLKDWTKIPGRPKSPTFEPSPIKFERIVCTQEDLDLVLSGHLKAVQEFVKIKYGLLPFEVTVDNCNKVKNFIKKETEIDLKMDVDCIEICENDELNRESSSTKQNTSIEVIDVENPNWLTVKQSMRSCSPDIFDDEVSEIIDSPIKDHQFESCKNNSKPCYDTVNLTECVINVHSHRTNINSTVLSQGNNTTRRKSNDFMDITGCVVGSSQPIRENIIEENVDLTQNSDEEDNVINLKNLIRDKNSQQSVDLTQSSDTNEELPVVQISGRDISTMDDTIMLNVDDNDNYSSSISVKDFLAEDKELIANNVVYKLVCHTNTSNKKLDNRAISPVEHKGETKTLTEHEKSREKIDTCLELEISETANDNDGSKSKTQSFFEEFVHQHSESSEDNTDDILCVDDASTNSLNTESDENKNNRIDLTQKPDTSEDAIKNIEEQNSPKLGFFSKDLGKLGDVSIDYDELFDEMARSHASSTSQSKSTSSSNTIGVCSKDVDNPSNSDLVSNSSQHSEPFEIFDKELDYSIHQSKLDLNPQLNLDFGGISILDAIPDLPSFRPSTSNVEIQTLNRSMSDSFLPMVDIRGTGNNNKAKSCSSVPTSRKQSSGDEVVAKTPKNGEYIIKTDAVTPMLNYERMTTPERNAELDKYGLKPFKRKRAIQLLTHLYNQTHPIVESLEDLPSPTKKFKPTISQPTSTHRKSAKKVSTTTVKKLPKKIRKSLRKAVDGDEHNIEDIYRENDIYEVTNEVPEIRDTECCEEDWVFQKREKAKLHSCRVPLHVAFHNYVSTRRRLLEAILRYEPVNIDLVHKGLVNNGLRFHPKELLKFMDKKCITVKTADNYARSKKHY